MIKKNIIKLSESDFKKLIKESVKNILENNFLMSGYEDFFHNGKNEFIIAGDKIDFSSNPLLKQFFDNLKSNYGDYYDEIMSISVYFDYRIYKGDPGNYGLYIEPTSDEIKINDIDFELSNELEQEINNYENKEIKKTLYNFLKDYVEDYISYVEDILYDKDPLGEKEW
jgi:hypothetical protein